MAKRELTGQDFVNMLDAGIKPVVEFNSSFEHGSYAEKGMRARIIKYSNLHDDLVYFDFDFDEFAALNAPLETSNFYDKNNEPCLTAREYGCLKNGVEHTCVGLNYINSEFSLAANTGLFFEYSELKTNESYVKWLEQQVMDLRAAEYTL